MDLQEEWQEGPIEGHEEERDRMNETEVELYVGVDTMNERITEAVHTDEESEEEDIDDECIIIEKKCG